MPPSSLLQFNARSAAILAAAQITPIHSEVKNIEEVSDTILTDSRTLTTSKFMGLK